MGQSLEGFDDLVNEIMALGFDEETAAHYAALIGDTPIMDAQGLIVVREGKREIARLKLKSFKED